MDREQQRKEDDILVRRAKEGDYKSFEALVQKYHRQIVNVSYLIMGNREAAEDATQEVFIKVYNKLSLYSPDTSFFSWLYRMTINTCIDEIRKRKMQKLISLDFLTEEGVESLEYPRERELPSTELHNDEKKEMVNKAMQMLSKEHREVLVLREYVNYGYNEIAETLGISVQAVKSRIFRARAELRTILLKHFKDEL
ncbi:MAG TPA: sigma-70 family RNA polymerase sigma factor [Bacteroidota bacterium]|nr:sigma-70 family RNA polymerase sigma factor [Bacteroidota bacterium]